MLGIKAVTTCLVLASQLFSSQSVPVHVDKTLVKAPEEQVQEAPQSVVSWFSS